MARKKNDDIIEVDDGDIIRRSKPAISIAAKERQMINLAIDLAEKKLRDGTAADSTINYYLKLASERESFEREKIRRELALLEAKTDQLKSSQNGEKLYAEAMEALTGYRGES